jgi:hypothetical protein
MTPNVLAVRSLSHSVVLIQSMATIRHRAHWISPPYSYQPGHKTQEKIRPAVASASEKDRRGDEFVDVFISFISSSSFTSCPSIYQRIQDSIGCRRIDDGMTKGGGGCVLPPRQRILIEASQNFDHSTPVHSVRHESRSNSIKKEKKRRSRRRQVSFVIPFNPVAHYCDESPWYQQQLRSNISTRISGALRRDTTPHHSTALHNCTNHKLLRRGINLGIGGRHNKEKAEGAACIGACISAYPVCISQN